MKFIRVRGRVVPVKDNRESRLKTLSRKTLAGAKVGGALGASVIAGHHLSEVMVYGKTFVGKRSAKALGIGLAAGAGLGALSGAFGKRRKK